MSKTVLHFDNIDHYHPSIDYGRLFHNYLKKIDVDVDFFITILEAADPMKLSVEDLDKIDSLLEDIEIKNEIKIMNKL